MLTRRLTIGFTRGVVAHDHWKNEIIIYFIPTATGSQRLRVTAAPGPSAGSKQTALVATLPGKWPPLDLCPI